METALLRQELLSEVASLHKHLSDFVMDIVAPYNVTKVQFGILIELADHTEPIKVSDLGRSLGMSDSNISAICKRMEKEGLLTRTRDVRDQRVVNLQLTPGATDCLKIIRHNLEDRWFSRMERLEHEEQVLMLKSLRLANKIWADC